jgi:hypothetical protein
VRRRGPERRGLPLPGELRSWWRSRAARKRPWRSPARWRRWVAYYRAATPICATPPARAGSRWTVVVATDAALVTVANVQTYGPWLRPRQRRPHWTLFDVFTMGGTPRQARRAAQAALRLAGTETRTSWPVVEVSVGSQNSVPDRLRLIPRVLSVMALARWRGRSIAKTRRSTPPARSMAVARYVSAMDLMSTAVATGPAHGRASPGPGMAWRAHAPPHRRVMGGGPSVARVPVPPSAQPVGPRAARRSPVIPEGRRPARGRILPPQATAAPPSGGELRAGSRGSDQTDADGNPLDPPAAETDLPGERALEP